MFDKNKADIIYRKTNYKQCNNLPDIQFIKMNFMANDYILVIKKNTLENSKAWTSRYKNTGYIN